MGNKIDYEMLPSNQEIEVENNNDNDNNNNDHNCEIFIVKQPVTDLIDRKTRVDLFALNILQMFENDNGIIFYALLIPDYFRQEIRKWLKGIAHASGVFLPIRDRTLEIISSCVYKMQRKRIDDIESFITAPPDDMFAQWVDWQKM